MRSIVKEAPQFIRFLRKQGHIFEFDNMMIILSVPYCKRAMLAQLVGNYHTPAWSSSCEATSQEQIEIFVTAIGNILFRPDMNKICKCTHGQNEGVCEYVDRMEDALCTNLALAEHFNENSGICTSALMAGLKPTVSTAIAGVVDQHSTLAEIVQAALRVESNSVHFAVHVVAAQHTPSTGNGFKSKKNKINW